MTVDANLSSWAFTIRPNGEMLGIRSRMSVLSPCELGGLSTASGSAAPNGCAGLGMHRRLAGRSL